MRCRGVAAGLAGALVLGALVAGGLGAGSSPVAAAEGRSTVGASIVRDTTLGRVRGIDESRSAGTYSWLGIPYAEPPVGDLRWKPTVAHRPWRGVRATRQLGEGCAQPGRTFSPSPSGPRHDLSVRDGLGKPVGQEDCLTLNVHRPAGSRSDLPVIVFVHGGSNVVGWSGDPMYDGRELAERTQSIVVTVNYRLGVFGWFRQDAPAGGDPTTDSGNYGLLDQVEALRFVHDNARAFGGDSSEVTVMGESAGAVNVWALMISPLTKGLLHQVIPLSGGLATTSPEAGQQYADAVTTAAIQDHGDGASDPALLLRSLSSDELVQVTLDHGLDATPAVFADGAVVPADPQAALASARSRKIAVLAGNNFEEGKLFGAAIAGHRPTERERFTLQYRFDPDRPSNLTARDLISDPYLPLDAPGGWEDATEALTDSVFHGIVERSMNTLVASGNQRVFYYQFGWNQQPEPFDQVYGAVHALDLPFVFGNFGRTVFSYAFSKANRPGRLALSDLMIDSIDAFVHTGSPQHRGLDNRWQQWPSSTVFDATDRRAWTCTGRFGGTFGSAASNDRGIACS